MKPYVHTIIDTLMSTVLLFTIFRSESKLNVHPWVNRYTHCDTHIGLSSKQGPTMNTYNTLGEFQKHNEEAMKEVRHKVYDSIYINF
jgi:hypothetical protein